MKTTSQPRSYLGHPLLQGGGYDSTIDSCPLPRESSCGDAFGRVILSVSEESWHFVQGKLREPGEGWWLGARCFSRKSALLRMFRVALLRGAQARRYLAVFFLPVLLCCGSLAFGQNPEIHAAMERARQDLAQHDLQKAVQEYAEILKLDPGNAEIYSADGVALYGLGKAREAAEVLQKALSLDPGQSTAELFLGLSQSSMGQCKDAIPLLRKHLGLPTPMNLRRVAGISLLSCYRETAQFEQALDLARTLKKSFPADADVLYNVAELYTQLWDVTASELLKDHPESYRVHQLAGEVLEAQGKYPQAIKEYQLAIRENNKVPDLHYRIGKMLLEQGGPCADDQAMAYFKQELQINPEDPAPEYSIAEILRQQRQFSQAEQHFRHALQMSPDFVEAHVGLGQTLLAEHQLEAARHELEKAAELRPDGPAAHYGLMMVYRDLGKSESAAKEMALFQELTAKQRQDFRSRLQALLAGKNPVPQPSH